MIDFYTPQYNKKIRGFTKLKLDNGNETRVYESENTFYPENIAQYVKQLGNAANGVGRSYSWQSVVGGVFLFDKTIPSGKKYMPAGTKMIGNGSYNITNSGNPEEMGSNVSNTLSNNRLEMNYTWDVSHGNGLINSVCLTSSLGGAIGYGNPSGTEDSSKKYQIFINSDTNIDKQGLYYKGYIYNASVSNGKLTVTKTPVNVDIATIFAASSTIVHDLTLTYPSDISWYAQENKLVFFYIGSSWPVNTTKSMLIYNVDTDTVDEKVITNNSGANITSTGGGFPNTSIGGLDVVNHKMFISVYDNYPYLVDYETSEFIRSMPRASWAKIAPDLFVGGSYSASASPQTGLVVYDSVNDTFYKWNGSTYITNNYNNSRCKSEFSEEHDIFINNCLSINQVGSFSPKYYYTNPLYLATVNNLAEPVPKTDSDILQLQYVLTDS